MMEKKNPPLNNQLNNHPNHIIGHMTQITRLAEALESQRLPHAMLFVGPESIGKKKTAFALAQKILCENPPINKSLEACRMCPSCTRVSKNQSENVLYIEPEGLHIKIDQTRAVIQFLSLSNFDRSRIIIIDHMHLMNPQAASSLLKTIEEPSQNVYFIFIAPEAESVMSTIRSRSQITRFSPLTLKHLKEIKPGLAEWAYKCSRGQLQRLENLSGEEVQNKRLQSFDLLHSFWTEPDFLNFTAQEKSPEKSSHWRLAFKDREEALSIVKTWVLIMRDVLVLKMEATGSILNSDQIQRLQKLVFLENLTINLFISRLLKIEKDIQGYMDSTLMIESLWINNARK